MLLKTMERDVRIITPRVLSVKYGTLVIYCSETQTGFINGKSFEVVRR